MRKYRIIELPTLGGRSSFAYAINNNGVVVGAADGSESEEHDKRQAVLWRGNRILGSGVPGSEASAINDRGQVLCIRGPLEYGMRSDKPRWKAPAPFIWEESGKQTRLPTSYLYADINDSGVLAVNEPARDPIRRMVSVLANGRAGIYREGKFVPLPVPPGTWGSGAGKINNRGNVIGVITKNDWEKTNLFTKAVVWRDGKVYEIPGVWKDSRRRSPVSISGDGTIVGDILDEKRGSIPFLWRGDNVTILPMPRGAKGDAAFLNDRGEVVGQMLEGGTSYPCLWAENKWFNINDLVINLSGWKIAYISGINNNGQMAGQGRFNGKFRGFRLEPV